MSLGDGVSSVDDSEHADLGTWQESKRAKIYRADRSAQDITRTAFSNSRHSSVGFSVFGLCDE